ncbi:MAG: hypothetical protein K2X47_03365 [Bdellovibrionales bacterium]|nr:hypothetical protein [Bdellovibrionales bacterium]
MLRSKVFCRLLVCALLGSVGCSTTGNKGTIPSATNRAPKKSEIASKVKRGGPTNSAETQQIPPEDSPIEPIDFEALKKTVGLLRERQHLGYIEKVFDGCGPQFGLLAGSCKRHYLISVQYRLMCRDSEGTVSEAISTADLQAIPNQALAWNLKGLEGQSSTDMEGYGEVLTISTISQRDQRLKLSNGNDFLYLRAGEVERLVTPVTWCVK